MTVTSAVPWKRVGVVLATGCAVLLLAHKEDDGYDIGNFKGIGFRYPVLGGLLTLFLVSLAGIPPSAPAKPAFPIW